jgi:hypothetical protein
MAKLGWTTFREKHLSPYTALIAVHAKQVKPYTPSSVVQAIVAKHATADWATVSSRTLETLLNAGRSASSAPIKLAPKGVFAIVVYLETKADFDSLKQVLNGRPWQSVVLNAADSFGATIP